MNKIFRLLSLPICLLFLGLESREIRTPLTPLDAPPLRGYIHYPIYELEDEDECDWDIDVAGGAYTRHSDKAYDCEFGTETTSLSNLFFGQSSFRIEQAMANSTANVARNPWVNISTLTPELEYNERGAVFGLNFAKLSDCGFYRYGARFKLPVRFITVRDNRCDCAGDTVSDVCLLNQEVYPAEDPVSNTVKDVYAYRLDFLASLRNADGSRALNFSDSNQSNRVTWGTPNSGADLTCGNNSSNGSDIVGAKVHLLGGTKDGGKPMPNFGLEQLEVNKLGALPADGSGLVFPNRMVFGAPNNQTGCEQVNYSGIAPNTSTSTTGFCDQNIDTLSNIWVVPSITINNATNEYVRTQVATTLNSDVQEMIRYLDESVLDYLEEVGVNLTTQHQEGVGDLNSEVFCGYKPDDCSYLEMQFGVKFPTGKKVRNANNPLLMPLGNNGHTELRLGTLLDYDVCDWFKMHADANYSWALKACEAVATPFKGACVKNIGPCTQAEISWNYFLAHLNFTFVPPCNDHVGFAIGYEPYVKQKDKITLRQDMLADFAGNDQEVDPSVLARKSRVISQRVVTEFFYVECDYNFIAGWTHVFAGQNVPKDTDFYVGFQVGF